MLERDHANGPLDEDPGVALLRRWQEQGDPDALDELLRLESAS